MNENDDIHELITVGSYLTKDEADSIKSRLTSMKIEFVVNGQYAASRYRSLYYEIKVQRKDFENAKRIVKNQLKKTLIENQKCPKCKNLEYTILEKKGLWQKIYYYGTTLVQCKKCETKYLI